MPWLTWRRGGQARRQQRKESQSIFSQKRENRSIVEVVLTFLQDWPHPSSHWILLTCLRSRATLWQTTSSLLVLPRLPIDISKSRLINFHIWTHKVFFLLLTNINSIYRYYKAKSFVFPAKKQGPPFLYHLLQRETAKQRNQEELCDEELDRELHKELGDQPIQRPVTLQQPMVLLWESKSTDDLQGNPTWAIFTLPKTTEPMPAKQNLPKPCVWVDRKTFWPSPLQSKLKWSRVKELKSERCCSPPSVRNGRMTQGWLVNWRHISLHREQNIDDSNALLLFG